MRYDNDKAVDRLYQETLENVFVVNGIFSVVRQKEIVDTVKQIVRENIKIAYKQGYSEGIHARNILN